MAAYDCPTPRPPKKQVDGRLETLTEDEHYVKITQVYTVPEFCRRNYAGRMVYEICREVVANGQMPMLYADADYYASNRCYQNIGFELKGRLVTIGVKKEKENE